MSRPSVRGKLVEAALETFHARGFNGCSVQDIVDAAGVPKGSFYNHFKTKEALALEVLAVYRAQSEELKSGAQTKSAKKKAPLKRLRAQFEALGETLEQWKFARGCLMGTFSAELSEGDEALREALDEGFKAWSREVAAQLREAQSDGSLSKKHDADRLGRYLVNAWQGAVGRAKLVQSRKPLDEFFAVTFDSLLV